MESKIKTRFPAIAMVQLIGASISIPLTFFPLIEGFLSIVLGGGEHLIVDIGILSFSRLFVAFISAFVAFFALLFSIFVSLQMLQYQEWTWLGTLITQGIILTAKLLEVFAIDPKVNWLTISFSAVIIAYLITPKLKSLSKKAKNPALLKPVDENFKVSSDNP